MKPARMMDVRVVWIFCAFWALARSQCQTEQAIQGTNACGSSFKSQVSEKRFNASNPEDLHEACCSMDRLERCLHKASADAGCKEEVSSLVHTLIHTARDLLGDVYYTNCKYECSAAPRFHVTSGYTLLIVCVTFLLYSQWSTES